MTMLLDKPKAPAPQDLYAKHVADVLAETGAQLPPWEALPKWEKELWAEYREDLAAH